VLRRHSDQVRTIKREEFAHYSISLQKCKEFRIQKKQLAEDRTARFPMCEKLTFLQTQKQDEFCLKRLQARKSRNKPGCLALPPHEFCIKDVWRLVKRVLQDIKLRQKRGIKENLTGAERLFQKEYTLGIRLGIYDPCRSNVSASGNPRRFRSMAGSEIRIYL
jgi:hypothetical protein